jgi:hypothetical protein
MLVLHVSLFAFSHRAEVVGPLGRFEGSGSDGA